MTLSDVAWSTATRNFALAGATSTTDFLKIGAVIDTFGWDVTSGSGTYVAMDPADEDHVTVSWLQGFTLDATHTQLIVPEDARYRVEMVAGIDNHPTLNLLVNLFADASQIRPPGFPAVGPAWWVGTAGGTSALLPKGTVRRLTVRSGGYMEMYAGTAFAFRVQIFDADSFSVTPSLYPFNIGIFSVLLQYVGPAVNLPTP